MQKIKDRYLVLGVALLVCVDLIILVTYFVVEGVRGNLGAQQVSYRERPRKVEGVSTINLQHKELQC